MVKMNVSGNSSPTNNDGSSSETDEQQQHVVYVHINQGETFSVRVGENVQHIQGPAMVQMVSHNGPPYPFPMQVPPGHMVQQIVDENNILTHVILSRQAGANQHSPDSHHHLNSHSIGLGHFVPDHGFVPSPHQHHPRMVPPHHFPPNPPLPPHAQSPCIKHMSPEAKRNRRFHRHRIEGNYPNGHHNEKALEELLSKCKVEVTETTARSAMVRIDATIAAEESENGGSSVVAEYDVLLSEKTKPDRHKLVHHGIWNDIQDKHLTDLKPFTHYGISLKISGHERTLSQVTSFTTSACEPDAPPPPKLSSRSKATLLLKWNPSAENGSKVSQYSLECQGQDGKYAEIYSGINRQFKVTKLQVSSSYKFRLVAINKIGRSKYSDEVVFWTTGSAPGKPDPPKLLKHSSTSLTVTWPSRPTDDEYTLQVEDQLTGHGFIAVYNGPSSQYTVSDLRRNTDYKFRVNASNEAGTSLWSDVANFTTAPERPGRPGRPHIHNKVTPYTVEVNWNAPSNTGGTSITNYILEADLGQGYMQLYGGELKEHVCNRLTPGGVHKMRLACENASGRSDWSEELTITAPPVCPKDCSPPRLQGKVKPSMLSLQWAYPAYDGGTPVSNYELQMTDPDDTSCLAYAGSDTVCTITDLSPGKQYRFIVRASNKVGFSPWSESADITTGPGAPEAPEGLVCSPLSPHVILGQWSVPLGNGAPVTEYKLEWIDPSTLDFAVIYTGSLPSHEVKHLLPSSTYVFRSKACNVAGWSTYSDVVSCTTSPSTPGAVPSFKVTVVTSNSIHVNWSEPANHGSDVKSYNIEITGNSHNTVSIGPEMEYTITDLLPETLYRLRIQAVNDIGMGPFSMAAAVETMPLPPDPPRLECCGTTPNTLKLKWGDGKNPKLLKYTLQMMKEEKTVTLYQGTHQSHKVTRLTDETDYRFCMYASNESGTSPASEEFVFKTATIPPLSCAIDRVGSITSNGCYIDWSAVPKSSDIIFTLQLAEESQAYKQVYRGMDFSTKLSALMPETNYVLQLSAMRKNTDSQNSAFSPTMEFRTAKEPPRVKELSHETKVEDQITGFKMDERKWAAAILMGFTFVSLLFAIIFQNIVD